MRTPQWRLPAYSSCGALCVHTAAVSRSESTRFLQTMDCPSYFKAVEAQIKAEEERADTLLDPALSKDKLLRALLDVYVASQARAPLVCLPLYAGCKVCCIMMLAVPPFTARLCMAACIWPTLPGATLVQAILCPYRVHLVAVLLVVYVRLHCVYISQA